MISEIYLVQTVFTYPISNTFQFEMRCALRGFHLYRSICKSRIVESLQIKPEYVNVYDPFAIAITRNIDSIWCGGSHSKGDLPTLPILFKLLRSTRRESKKCEVQEVSISERWTRNSNNNCGKKAQGFAGGVQQNERNYIGVLQGAKKYKKSKVHIEISER